MVLTGEATRWVKLNLPKGKYRFEIISPYNGQPLKKGFFTHDKSGIKELTLPQFGEMAALKLVKM